MSDNGSRFYNLDRFLDETDERPVNIRLLGKKWNLPSSAPADVILRAQRVRAITTDLVIQVREDPDATLTDDMIPQMRDALTFDFRAELRKLVGDEIADKWLADKRLTYPKLQQLYWRIVGIYEGTEEGEAEAPSKGATRKKTASRRKTSSGRGPSSRRTSTASTA